MRISDWSSDVCSSDLARAVGFVGGQALDAVDAVGGGGGALVRREVADEIGAAAWNGLAPVARIGLELRLLAGIDQIGRASCRDRVCPYVSISVVAVSLKKKNRQRSE